MKRLVLFDIDGTLVWGGPAKEAFLTALSDLFGTAGPLADVPFAGRTDPEIARNLLQLAGVPDDEIDEGLPELWNRYPVELEQRLPADPVVALPGVKALLDALASLPDVAVGLVTGNIWRGAMLKLQSAGLGGRFTVGGFGSDHEERNHLPGIAMERATDEWGVAFDPADVVVVGDTPKDVECGRHHGTRTYAVATGHFDVEALRATGADHVTADLTSTAAVLDHLIG